VIHLIVDLKAVPKARPRFTRSGHVYTPKPTTDFESYIRKCAQMMFDEPYLKAVEVRVIFNFKKAKTCKLVKCTKRPDLDNLLKGVLDALNGVAFKDDSQVTRIVSEKNFSETDNIEITIAEV